MTISISDLPAIWRPVGDPIVIADASVATTIHQVSNSDGFIIWTDDQAIRVKVLEPNSSDVATADEGFPVNTVDVDGIRFVPLYRAKASVIEQVAGADVQYQYIEFLKG